MKYKILKIVTLAITFIALLGCTSKGIFHDANEGVDKNVKNIQQLKAADAKPIPPVVSKTSYYSDKDPIAAENRPLWLRNSISISGKKLPFSFVMQRILRNTSVLAKYQTGVRKEKLVSIDYSGTVKGALDLLATQTNYAYEPTDTDITWEAFVTKTFNISFMPGASTYQVGQTSATSASNNNNSSSSSGTTTAQTGTLFSNDQQFSGLQAASLSVWNDVRSTLEQLKSTDGKVAVSEATTMVTVYDHPTNVEAIGRYIEQLNKSLSKQVHLKVQVLEVDLDKEHSLGIDWNVVQHWWGQSISLAGNLGTAANVANSVGSSSISSSTAPVALQFGPNGGSNVILQALSTQGKVSVVTEPSVVTMNNQVAEIRIARDTSYLQSVNVTTEGNGTGSNITTALTPGIVTDGFILYLLPKIKDNRVYLQVSSILSELTSLNTINSAGAVNQSTTTDNNVTPLNAIQTPTLNEKRFNIRSLVANNATLIIGGFKQVRDTTRENKLFGIKNGQGAQTINSETIILITPTIVEN